MKIKFETKVSKSSFGSNGVFTIFAENKGDEMIELLITKLNVKQLELPNKNPIAQKCDVPINDGIVTISKLDMKKLVKVLKVLIES